VEACVVVYGGFQAESQSARTHCLSLSLSLMVSQWTQISASRGLDRMLLQRVRCRPLWTTDSDIYTDGSNCFTCYTRNYYRDARLSLNC